MIFRILKRTFWVFYDNLFKGVFLNFLFFLILFLVFLLNFRVFKIYFWGIIIIYISWHVITPSFIYVWSKIIKNDEVKIFKDLFFALKTFSLKGLLISIINIIIFYIGYVSIEFYKGLITSFKSISLILGGIGIWMLLVFILMHIYILPIFVLDEKRRIFISFKKALLMVLSIPFSSFFILLIVLYLNLGAYPFFTLMYGASKLPLSVALISLFPIFLMPFFTYSTIILLQLNSTFLVYEKHNIYPDLSEIWEDRTFSNFLRPWENR